MSENVWESRARERKAHLIANALRAREISADNLFGRLEDEGLWQMIAGAAETKLPSITTRRMVLEDLRQSEAGRVDKFSDPVSMEVRR